MLVLPDAARLARVAAQHLGARVDDVALAASAGLRDSPAGAARDALAARLTPGVASNGRFRTVGDRNRQLDDGLVAVWGPRAAPYLVAEGDVGVFTRGALPADEASARKLAPSATKALDPHGILIVDAVARVAEAMGAAVADGPVARDDLHQRLREALPPELLWWCKGCQSHHVHPMLWRAAAQRGGVRRDEDAPGRAVTFAAIAEPPDPAGDAAARAELTRRALHHHGPLTTAELAAWLAASRADAAARLSAIADEVTEVARGGRGAWALRADLPRLGQPPAAHGVRLLPTGDPLLDGRDRASLLPDPTEQREVWKALAAPGAVLHDGRIVATWRAKATGRDLAVTLAPLGGRPLPPAELVLPEAEALAAARGLEGATVG
jgi:Winged helix DNA-binding domain